MEHVAIIDILNTADICSSLEDTGLRLLRLPCTPRVSQPLSGHPDIQLFIHGKRAFVHPHIDVKFLKQLENFCDINICGTALSDRYT